MINDNKCTDIVDKEDAIRRAEGYLQYLGATKNIDNSWTFVDELNISDDSPLVYDNELIVKFDYVKDLCIFNVTHFEHNLPNYCDNIYISSSMVEYINYLPICNKYRIYSCAELKELNYSFPDCHSINISNCPDLEGNLKIGHLEEAEIFGNFTIDNICVKEKLKLNIKNTDFVNALRLDYLELYNVDHVTTKAKKIDIENFNYIDNCIEDCVINIIEDNVLFNIKGKNFKFNGNGDTEFIIDFTGEYLELNNCILNTLTINGKDVEINDCKIKHLYLKSPKKFDIFKIRNIDNIRNYDQHFSKHFHKVKHIDDKDLFYKEFINHLIKEGLKPEVIKDNYFLIGESEKMINNLIKSEKGVEKFDL